MILVGNSRGGGQNLAAHLLKSENEHIELYDMRGFTSDDLHGAFKEAYAISKATKATKYLYSLSLNPPEEEQVSTEVFDAAIARIEQKLTLDHQPRVIVFHEKEGRRHCHVVWSRIDAEKLIAVPMDFHKRELNKISRDLFLEHGWKLPEGFMSPALSDPLNYTLAEYQQALRLGQDARYLKGVFHNTWKTSDSKTAFAHALREHGLILARGRRGHVAVNADGKLLAVSKWVGLKAKEVKAKLGGVDDLPSVEKATEEQACLVKPALDKWQAEVKQRHTELKTAQTDQKQILVRRQKQERHVLLNTQQQRRQSETAKRQQRFNKGIRGLWDRLTGKHGKIKRLNEKETVAALQRDKQEKDALIFRQLAQRRSLKKAHKQQVAALQDRHEQLVELRAQFPNAEPANLARSTKPDGPKIDP